MTEFRWKGAFVMGAVQAKDGHHVVHLWGNPGIDETSLCGRLRWYRDVIQAVATGWPDCDACESEAFKRLAIA